MNSYVQRFYMTQGIDANNREESLRKWYAACTEFDEAFDKVREFYDAYVEGVMEFGKFKTLAIGAGSDDSMFSVAEHNFRDQFIGDFPSIESVVLELANLQFDLRVEDAHDTAVYDESHREGVVDESLTYPNIWSALCEHDVYYPIVLNSVEFMMSISLRDMLMDIINNISPASMEIKDSGEVQFEYKSKSHQNVRPYLYKYVFNELFPDVFSKVMGMVNKSPNVYLYSEPVDEHSVYTYTFLDFRYASKVVDPRNFSNTLNSLTKHHLDNPDEYFDAHIEPFREYSEASLEKAFEDLWEQYGNVTPIKKNRVFISNDIDNT